MMIEDNQFQCSFDFLLSVLRVEEVLDLVNDIWQYVPIANKMFNMMVEVRHEIIKCKGTYCGILIALEDFSEWDYASRKNVSGSHG